MEMNTLAQEHRRAEFDVDAMKVVWAGCVEHLHLSQRMSNMVSNDPVFQKEFRVTQRWSGALHKVAIHVVVYARLLIDGKDYGVHVFIVQVRSLEDHQPLSEVIVGDIDVKFGNGGHNTMDNGFFRFKNVHIPRDHLLMRLVIVKKEGKYVQLDVPRQLGYGAMVFVRKYIIMDASNYLSRAITIAT
ncbi:hypothetical protein L7F22_052177 [Adiantum nelumboides]|nr:hypothetical protein [Adiantum nelumboides]